MKNLVFSVLSILALASSSLFSTSAQASQLSCRDVIKYAVINAAGATLNSRVDIASVFPRYPEGSTPVLATLTTQGRSSNWTLMIKSAGNSCVVVVAPQPADF